MFRDHTNTPRYSAGEGRPRRRRVRVRGLPSVASLVLQGNLIHFLFTPLQGWTHLSPPYALRAAFNAGYVYHATIAFRHLLGSNPPANLAAALSRVIGHFQIPSMTILNVAWVNPWSHVVYLAHHNAIWSNQVRQDIVLLRNQVGNHGGQWVTISI